MPNDLTFTITGMGSNRFVQDWAAALGYRTQISKPDDIASLFDNPETPTEFLLKNIFVNAKTLVEEHRTKREMVTVTEGIKSELDTISIVI